jgi:hypothetical protein
VRGVLDGCRAQAEIEQPVIVDEAEDQNTDAVAFISKLMNEIRRKKNARQDGDADAQPAPEDVVEKALPPPRRLCLRSLSQNGTIVA